MSPEHATMRLDEWQPVDVRSMDFSGAFNSLNHRFPNVKLPSIETVGKARQWANIFSPRRSLVVKLTDPVSHGAVAVSVYLVNVVGPSVTLDANDTFGKILPDFPPLTGPANNLFYVRSVVVHHISAAGPVFGSSRHLAPDKLANARHELHQMMDPGITRPSNSLWASPLHIGPKKTSGDWRPCGDYRRADQVITPDLRPVPHIHETTFALAGSNIIKIDLTRACRQIPVIDKEVAKIAVSWSFSVCNLACTMLPKRSSGLLTLLRAGYPPFTLTSMISWSLAQVLPTMSSIRDSSSSG
ncbi:unnamed protein product [Fasciola hepatica]|uniref:Uncharacterized protein n=1 Tax=Fasciola hepatica TaxID=6192 RepID=A0ABC9HJC4_FASHE|nr:unnamed protein product [Fasciola hepatica]